MATIKPNPKKRSYLLPAGCKDLIDVLNGPATKRLPVVDGHNAAAAIRVNGRITAKKVRVIDEKGKDLGAMSVADALRLAQRRNIDLVEIAPRSRPPTCRIVDYGRFRYELSRKRKNKTL